MDVKHPEVEVELVGNDGNAFSILANVRRSLRKAGVPQSEIDEFVNEATSGDYDHLLQTCIRWVTVL